MDIPDGWRRLEVGEMSRSTDCCLCEHCNGAALGKISYLPKFCVGRGDRIIRKIESPQELAEWLAGNKVTP